MRLRALLTIVVLGALGARLAAQDTRPVFPPPKDRPVPKTSSEIEDRLARLRAFLAVEEPRVQGTPDAPDARRVAHLKEQASVLQRLGEARRVLAEEAAEASRVAKDKAETEERAEELKRLEKSPTPTVDPRLADAEARLKAEREDLEARGRQARATRERLAKELDRARALRESIAADVDAAQKAVDELADDLKAESADASDYAAAGLEPEIVLLKEESAQVYRLALEEASVRLARLKRLQDGLLQARIELMERQIAVEDAELKFVDARVKEVDKVVDQAIQARYERARSEAGELDRLLARVPDWAKPYWRARRTLVDLRVELSQLARTQKLWEGRISTVGEIFELVHDAEIEASVLADVDAGRIDLYEVVSQNVEELAQFLAAKEAELARVRALADETREAQRAERAASRLARQNGADLLVANAEAARAAAAAPAGVEGAAWYEREALSDVKWGEVTAALRKAAEERASALTALNRSLAEAAKGLAEARARRERALIRYQSAARWTREGAEISFEAVERAFEDAKLAPEAVRQRALGAFGRFVDYGRDAIRSEDRTALFRVGGALAAALALLVAAARSIPRTARWLENWRGARAGAAFLVHLSAVLLRRTLLTGLLAFCAVALPAIAGAPRADVALAAILLGSPFALRTTSVLVDALLGREPTVKRPFKLNATFEAVFHAAARRLLWITAVFVPAALLLTVEGYRERNPGFVALIWLLHALGCYAVVLTVVLRPKHFLSVARDETGMAARIKTAVLVSYPAVAGAVIFLIVLRSLGYTTAVKYFLRQFLETAAWVVGAAVVHRRALGWATRGEAATPPPQSDPATDEEKWFAEGRAYLKDRALRLFVRLAVYVPATWFILQLWGLTGAGYDAAFGRPIWEGGTASPAEALTWANVVAALITTVACFYGVRLLRDLLRFVILPRTSLDTGLRYTVVTLVTYFVTAVSGFVVLGGQLKVDATVIGGFVAALGVGLGFGLKEIVDNFFSGVIVLVERPVKVGDIINVGATTGRVDRINMRSTTIMTGENKGLIVPNKDLISQQVTNWSAGSPTVRTSFKIGIDYGADTQLFRRVALDVLDSFGLVLKSPSPEVLFRGFGASSLDFEVFYWIRLTTNGMRLTSDLLFALDAALRKAGVGVPFPRQDVVIHPSSELRVRRVDDDGPVGGAARPAARADAPTSPPTPPSSRSPAASSGGPRFRDTPSVPDGGSEGE